MKIKTFLILSAAALSLAACGEHTHSFGDAWKSDDTSHWHECECGEKSDKADHLDTNTDGKCDVCDYDMEVPSPAGTEVTKEEWEAAFGSEKPFLFADNYKFNMLGKVNGVDFAEENFYADGNKFKDEPVKAPEGETLGSESYYSFENSKYIAYQLTGGKWSTHETSYTPIHDIIETSLAPFVDSDLFTYDETGKFYKCETTTIVAWDVTYTNLEIKFIDKKITEVSFTVEGVEDYICTLTYGGQTVTLPELEAWSSITYQEIKQAYNNKQNSPYNHREYEYIENNTTYRMIEDYSGIWVIDQEKSEGEATSSPLAWFEDQYNILVYESIIDQATMNIEKNETEHKYRYIFEYQTMKQVVILDEYFNYLQCLQYNNDQLSGGMQNIVYSIVN